MVILDGEEQGIRHFEPPRKLGHDYVCRFAKLHLAFSVPLSRAFDVLYLGYISRRFYLEVS